MNATQARSVQCWLPAMDRFASDHPLRAWLVRADPLPAAGGGYLGGLADWFSGVDADLPAAAITRQFLAGDAETGIWLSADPAWMQPDMNGVRLLACGQLQLGADEAEVLAATLHPVFDEAGIRLHLSTPDRWHLRLPDDWSLPRFVPPDQALGEDLAQYIPQGAEGRRWRILLNDIQVMLHQHPVNSGRAARGLAPVNSLWFWGAGHLPGPSRSLLRGVVSDDLLVRALAARAGLLQQPRSPQATASLAPGWLIDLQDLSPDDIATGWWPALAPQLEGQSCVLHFASGECWQRRPWHRWRFWRGASR